MNNALLIQSPIGPLTALESEGALRMLVFGDNLPVDAVWADTPLLRQTAAQLQEYFAGMRQVFDLPMAPKGTPFQQAVWQALLAIPYGQTRSYAQIASAVDAPQAMRAVGGANHRNPISIIIPCHRVIGAGGKLVGYGGGLDKKEALLTLEGHAATHRV